MKLRNLINKDLFLEKEKRYKMQLVIVAGVFFLAGVVFTIINFTGNREVQLGIITATFAAISLVVCILTLTVKKGRLIGQLLFVIATLIMFFYFLIFGGAGERGFSTYWILLLPFLSMLVMGLKMGLIASAIMFLAIVFFLWIPFGRTLLQWKPDEPFIIRFPLVYLAALLSSFLFELSRFFVDKNVDELNNKLLNLATHDYLTGLTNRHGLQQIVNEEKKYIGSPEFRTATCMLIDIDNFKEANDTFGHKFGDDVLISLANILKSKAGEWAIRFGGDEFVLLFRNNSDFQTKQIAEEIKNEVQGVTFKDHPEYKYTVSIGIASSSVTKDYKAERVIELADYQSSRAKKNGKNAIYFINYDEAMKEVSKSNKKSLSDILGNNK